MLCDESNTPFTDIQDVLSAMVTKMKKLEKSNEILLNEKEKLVKEAITFDNKIEEQIEQTQLWRETADLRDNELKIYHNREVKGIEIFAEWLGNLFMGTVDSYLQRFTEDNRKLNEMIIDLPREDREALAKFRKTQDSNLLQRIKKLQEIKQ